MNLRFVMFLFVLFELLDQYIKGTHHRATSVEFLLTVSSSIRSRKVNINVIPLFLKLARKWIKPEKYNYRKIDMSPFAVHGKHILGHPESMKNNSMHTLFWSLK